MNTGPDEKARVTERTHAGNMQLICLLQLFRLTFFYGYEFVLAERCHDQWTIFRSANICIGVIGSSPPGCINFKPVSVVGPGEVLIGSLWSRIGCKKEKGYAYQWTVHQLPPGYVICSLPHTHAHTKLLQVVHIHPIPPLKTRRSTTN
jgi:hypothetical protein